MAGDVDSQQWAGYGLGGEAPRPTHYPGKSAEGRWWTGGGRRRRPRPNGVVGWTGIFGWFCRYFYRPFYFRHPFRPAPAPVPSGLFWSLPSFCSLKYIYREGRERKPEVGLGERVSKIKRGIKRPKKPRILPGPLATSGPGPSAGFA